MVPPSLLYLLFGASRCLSHSQTLTLRIASREEDPATIDNPFASIVPASTLEWRACYGNASASEFGPVSCARLLAPIDYGNTSLGNVQLAIVRLGGSGSGQTHNAVFFNPGGPGDDPVESILTKASLIRAQVGNDSDIIAVVPRGVSSTFPPMTCDGTDLTSTRRLWEIGDTLPGYTHASVAESYAIGQNLGLDCGRVTPDLIPYIGTVAAAYDLEFVRKTLGQQKLFYLGHSYGTALGGTYAALFPDRVGRMVLDGVLDLNDYYSPNKDPSLDIGDADLALHNFFQACHDAEPDTCALWSNTTEGVQEHFMEADRRIFDQPLPVPGYGLLKWPLWRSGAYNALYRPAQGFPLLAGVASEILSGTAGPYTQAYMELVQSAASSTETYLVDSETGLKNSPNAGSVISCSDGGAQANDQGAEQLHATFARYQKVSEFFAGVSSQFVFICEGAKLSAKARYTKPFRNITTANPILFVGNTADPTTPVRNAHRMSEAFPSSRVLTIRGTGHLSFNAVQDTKCATDWIEIYFRDGTLPPEGTVCDGNQAPFASTVD